MPQRAFSRFTWQTIAHQVNPAGNAIPVRGFFAGLLKFVINGFLCIPTLAPIISCIESFLRSSISPDIPPVEITGLATGWGVAGARGGWLGTG